MTLFNTQTGNGEFRLQFETDDKDKFLYMQEKARICVDNKMASDQTVHAHWIEQFEGTYLRRAMYCSACKKKSGIGGSKANQMKPYCPNCGAKMDEE